MSKPDLIIRFTKKDMESFGNSLSGRIMREWIEMKKQGIPDHVEVLFEETSLKWREKHGPEARPRACNHS